MRYHHCYRHTWLYGLYAIFAGTFIAMFYLFKLMVYVAIWLGRFAGWVIRDGPAAWADTKAGAARVSDAIGDVQSGHRRLNIGRIVRHVFSPQFGVPLSQQQFPPPRRSDWER